MQHDYDVSSSFNNFYIGGVFKLQISFGLVFRQ